MTDLPAQGERRWRRWRFWNGDQLRGFSMPDGPSLDPGESVEAIEVAALEAAERRAEGAEAALERSREREYRPAMARAEAAEQARDDALRELAKRCEQRAADEKGRAECFPGERIGDNCAGAADAFATVGNWLRAALTDQAAPEEPDGC
jgi:hypothetical protein